MQFSSQNGCKNVYIRENNVQSYIILEKLGKFAYKNTMHMTFHIDSCVDFFLKKGQNPLQIELKSEKNEKLTFLDLSISTQKRHFSVSNPLLIQQQVNG